MRVPLHLIAQDVQGSLLLLHHVPDQFAGAASERQQSLLQLSCGQTRKASSATCVGVVTASQIDSFFSSFFLFTADGVLLISQQLDGDITRDGASAPVLEPCCCFLLFGWRGVLAFCVRAIEIGALSRVLSVTRFIFFFSSSANTK